MVEGLLVLVSSPLHGGLKTRLDVSVAFHILVCGVRHGESFRVRLCVPLRKVSHSFHILCETPL